ncbi:hypothetical protein CROQUDRAFT_28655, partial [Cronartium quercuum f. sp. fusiforme G11]
PPVWAHRLVSSQQQDNMTAYEVRILILLTIKAAMYGMVKSADRYLVGHKQKVRLADGLMRKQAREDLNKKGIIVTELELSKWKRDQLRLL